MAFGKKKDGAAPGEAEAADEIEPLFPADEGSDEAEADDGEVTADPEPTPAAAAVEAVAAAPDASDSLLSMFQSSDDEVSDRSVIIDLAGDVEIADLLEDLHTLAAAMGVNVTA
jgi:hypothetical protein